MAIVPCELGPFGDLAWWFRARRKTETFERCPRKKSVKNIQNGATILEWDAQKPTHNWSDLQLHQKDQHLPSRLLFSLLHLPRSGCGTHTAGHVMAGDVHGVVNYGNFMVMKPTVWISNFPVGLGFPQKASIKEKCQKGTPTPRGGVLFPYFLAFL